MAAATTARDLPEEVVLDILSWLPVKSLMRFRSVCKLWYNLIQNHDFISKHHSNQISNSSFTVFVRHGNEDERCVSLLSSNGSGNMLGVVATISELLPQLGFLAGPYMLGHVNGLVYLYYSLSLHFLWNFARKEVKILPSSPIKPLPGSTDRFCYNHGFGFDTKTQDYKIIRLFINVLDEDQRGDDQAELYSFKSDSWKEIKLDQCLFGMGDFVCDAYNNGVCYWWAVLRCGGHCPFIVAFNFADEVFEELYVPDFGVSMAENVCSRITVLKELLSVIVTKQEGLQRLIDVWVMKEHGVKESWEKQARIGHIEGLLYPLGFMRNTLFFVNEKEELVSYDSSTRELANLQLYGKEHVLRITNYSESLVQLNGSRILNY